MDEPTITVLIPTFNRAHLVGRAIESALSQCKSKDEVIVVDDGSTDETQEVLSRYAVTSMWIKNGGAGRARNHGITKSKCDLIAFLDSDDEWFPGRLELYRDLFRVLPECDYAFSDMASKSSSGSIVRNHLINWHHDQRNWSKILGSGRYFSKVTGRFLSSETDDFLVHMGSLYHSLCSAIYMCTSTVVVRREAAQESMRFAEDLPLYEDWQAFGYLARGRLGIYLDIETAWQHGHASPRLTGAGEIERSLARIAVLKNVWGNDQSYLSEYKEAYEALVDEQREILALEYFAIGAADLADEQLSVIRATLSPKLTILKKLGGRLSQLTIFVWRLTKKMIISRVKAIFRRTA